MLDIQNKSAIHFESGGQSRSGIDSNSPTYGKISAHLVQSINEPWHTSGGHLRLAYESGGSLSEGTWASLMQGVVLHELLRISAAEMALVQNLSQPAVRNNKIIIMGTLGFSE